MKERWEMHTGIPLGSTQLSNGLMTIVSPGLGFTRHTANGSCVNFVSETAGVSLLLHSMRMKDRLEPDELLQEYSNKLVSAEQQHDAGFSIISTQTAITAPSISQLAYLGRSGRGLPMFLLFLLDKRPTLPNLHFARLTVTRLLTDEEFKAVVADFTKSVQIV